MQTVANLISRHMQCYCEQECTLILAGLNVISKFDLNLSCKGSSINIEDFQLQLSKINEKELRRRDEGVYYTPKDVTEYVVANTYLNFVSKANNQVHSTEECIRQISKRDYSDLLFAKVFDPTCGTAEFLLSALDLKLKITKHLPDDEIICLVNTIYGNDIAEESVLLSKIRLFFAMVSVIRDKNNAVRLAMTINNNFSTHDYIINNHIAPIFDIVVGNPPYIEYRKLLVKPKTNYGNSFADVLHNSILSAKGSAAIGFVIPISFVSTTRMKGIRDYTYNKLAKMFVLNFADRPDCLFDGVHQKLTILFGLIGSNKCNVYSSSYYLGIATKGTSC